MLLLSCYITQSGENYLIPAVLRWSRNSRGSFLTPNQGLEKCFQPVFGFLLIVTKSGSNFSKLPKKAPEGDKQEENGSLAAAEEASTDVAVAVVLSELDGILLF